MANEPNEDEPLFHAATYTQAPKVSHKVLTKEERQELIKQHEEKQQEAAKLDQVASKGPIGRWWSRLQSGPNKNHAWPGDRGVGRGIWRYRHLAAVHHADVPQRTGRTRAR